MSSINDIDWTSEITPVRAPVTKEKLSNAQHDFEQVMDVFLIREHNETGFDLVHTSLTESGTQLPSGWYKHLKRPVIQHPHDPILFRERTYQRKVRTKDSFPTDVVHRIDHLFAPSCHATSYVSITQFASGKDEHNSVENAQQDTQDLK